jgi:hypothetical protein
MYTDEANEIYLKVCEKYKREPLDTMHTRTMLFECINIALKQGQLLPIDSVSKCPQCSSEDLDTEDKWCNKCGDYYD